MMTENSDPWKPLPKPDKLSSLSSRLVDPDSAWHLYWAKDAEEHCLLILRHASANRPTKRLPKLRGLEVRSSTPNPTGPSILILRLKEREQREIFHRLCEDISSAVTTAKSENEAVELFLARTWRWHRLLQGGKDGRLTTEEQKGLIGELRILKHLLTPCVGIRSAIQSWMGPLSAPKDFELGETCIEAKTRRGAATPFIEISNEFQLDTKGISDLILSVLDIAPATAEEKGITITAMAREILEKIQEEAPSIQELYEERLLATGFNWLDDYSDQRWLIGAEHLYLVANEFPRVTPEMYPDGVNRVRYSISLDSCEQYRTDIDTAQRLIAGGNNGDQH